MGNTICVTNEVKPLPPRMHFKCRYDPEDTSRTSLIYYDHKEIERFPVPQSKIDFKKKYDNYKPIEFTAEKILSKSNNLPKDPNIDDFDFQMIKFNEMDLKFECDRRSYHGPYDQYSYPNGSNIQVPRNPVGRTGIIGRGRLFRWGPNHAADPIVTRWKRDKNGQIIKNEESKKPILEFVSIQRRNTGEWAIPGGMRDPGEKINKTLLREFKEEALNINNNQHGIEFNKFERIVVNTQELNKILERFFKGGTEIYKGYMDDPRNTDNAWMETLACNFHDETGNIVGQFKLEGGDDAKDARWIELSKNLKLFASHVDLLREVAIMRKAHW